MKRQLILQPAAEADVADAFGYYEEQAAGLGREFVDALGVVLDVLSASPERYPIVYRTLTRVLLRRFPYAVFYLVESERVVVLAVLHQASDPERWRARVPSR